MDKSLIADKMVELINNFIGLKMGANDLCNPQYKDDIWKIFIKSYKSVNADELAGFLDERTVSPVQKEMAEVMLRYWKEWKYALMK